MDPESIEVDFPAKDMAKCAARMEDEFKAKQAQDIQQRDKLNVNIACRAVAHGIAAQRLSHGGNSLSFSVLESDESTKRMNDSNRLDFQVVEAARLTNITNTKFKATLNSFLEGYGLRVREYTKLIGRYQKCGEFHSGVCTVLVTVEELSDSEQT